MDGGSVLGAGIEYDFLVGGGVNGADVAGVDRGSGIACDDRSSIAAGIGGSGVVVGVYHFSFVVLEGAAYHFCLVFPGICVDWLHLVLVDHFCVGLA